MQYGYGIVAYRNTLFTMILAFLVFTVLAVPSMMFYSRGTAYSLNYKGTVGNEIYSIGNLGYSNIQCENAPLGIGIMTMACSYGTIGKIVDYGINAPSLGATP